MSDAAGQDEDMPRGMEVAQPVKSEEDNPESICQSSGAHPHDPVPPDGVKQRAGREDDKPTLEQVNQRRRHLESVHSEAFEDYSGDGESPLNSEDEPTQWAMQGNESERGVGARDKQVDGRVIKYMKDVPCPRAHQRVVERGAQVDEYQGAGKDGATDHMPRRPSRGGANHVYSTSHRKAESDAVCDRIG